MCLGERQPLDTGIAARDRIGLVAARADDRAACVQFEAKRALPGADPAGGNCLGHETLDFAAAAAIPTPGLTGVQLIEEQLDLQPGQRVLITGATGAVGRFAMFAAKARGATVIAAVRASQREEARALGADTVLTLGEEAWDGLPFDRVADTVGGAQVAALCRHVAPDGVIRTTATTPIPPEGLPVAPAGFAVHADAGRLAALAAAVAAGEITVPIARIFPFEEVQQAHRLLEAGGLGGKVILRP